MTLFVLIVQCATAVPRLRRHQHNNENALRTHHVNGTRTVPKPITVHFDSFLLEQLEYELRHEQRLGGHVVSKIAISIVSPGFFCLSFCGVDRCMMGQPLLGTLKGFTCGGFCIWFLIDFVVIMYNCLTSAPEINTFGFRATWAADTVTPAFWLALVFAVFHCVSHSCCIPRAKAKVVIRAEMRKWGISMKCLKPTADEIIMFASDFDKSHTGSISQDELSQMLARMGLEPLTQDEEKQLLTMKKDDGKFEIGAFTKWYISSRAVSV